MNLEDSTPSSSGEANGSDEQVSSEGFDVVESAEPEREGFQERIRKLRSCIRFPSLRTAQAIELAVLAIAAVSMGIAAAQLRVAVQDSEETQLVLAQVVALLVQEVEVSRQLFELQSSGTLDDPMATANAEQVRRLEATLESITTERQELLSSLEPTSTPMPKCDDIEVNITEVMAIPQAPGGDITKERRNEYVELHNYGSGELDVGGWFIADRGGNVGRIVTWDSQFRNIPIGQATTSTSVIPPQGYAVILPTEYDRGDRPYSQEIPSEALILTLEGTTFIGNGIVASTGEPLDVLILFTGSSDLIECPISTYGTPQLPLERSSPSIIQDDLEDDLPFSIPEEGGWGGFYRIHVDGDDTESNWKRFYWPERTPGWENPTSSSSP